MGIRLGIGVWAVSMQPHSGRSEAEAQNPENRNPENAPRAWFPDRAFGASGMRAPDSSSHA
jgi:hypothetical protein